MNLKYFFTDVKIFEQIYVPIIFSFVFWTALKKFVQSWTSWFISLCIVLEYNLLIPTIYGELIIIFAFHIKNSSAISFREESFTMFHFHVLRVILRFRPSPRNGSRNECLRCSDDVFCSFTFKKKETRSAVCCRFLSGIPIRLRDIEIRLSCPLCPSSSHGSILWGVGRDQVGFFYSFRDLLQGFFKDLSMRAK